MTDNVLWAIPVVVAMAAATQGIAREPAASGVVGRVVFAGQAPEPGQVRMGKDPICARLSEGPVVDNEVIVNRNGGLQNVIVYVREGLGDRAFDPPSDPVVLDQLGCMYTPRVVVVQVGQALEILNSDPTLHNVNSRSRANRQFNTGMPVQDMRIKRTFARPEILEMRCQVHSWMRAIVGVFDHPFVAVTGRDGSFALPTLPAGEYTLEAWHERFGTQTMQVSVAPGASKTVEFRLGG
ncbi:MAG: carboxypeptidase regulatory-like domain-containing protein [Gemmatimonadetes bacterium]|nr:carboxypeptidase regulatory-like domain-containing protein [Gemmatimonadota bacterium]